MHVRATLAGGIDRSALARYVRCICLQYQRSGGCLVEACLRWGKLESVRDYGRGCAQQPWVAVERQAMA